MGQDLSSATVRLAHRLFLDREPDSEGAVGHMRHCGTLKRLREVFLNSHEFELIMESRPRLVRADAPRLKLVWDADDATVRRLLVTLGAAWDGVAPADGDGGPQVADLLAILQRNDLALPKQAHGFELGCGAGRVTRDLARHLHRLTAADASPVQLAAAKSRVPGNVALRLADDLSFGMAEGFELFYSFRALQHGPPPLIARALAAAFAALRPGGIAVFQLPTHALGYSYPPDPALAPPSDPANDLHVLPQPVVFALAARHGCQPVEVIEDLAAGPSALWRSNLFVLRKQDG